MTSTKTPRKSIKITTHSTQGASSGGDFSSTRIAAQTMTINQNVDHNVDLRISISTGIDHSPFLLLTPPAATALKTKQILQFEKQTHAHADPRPARDFYQNSERACTHAKQLKLYTYVQHALQRQRLSSSSERRRPTDTETIFQMHLKCAAAAAAHSSQRNMQRANSERQT